MGPWGSYDLGDFLMFAPETYYRLFARLNEAVWPLPIVMLALGTVIPLLLRSPPPWPKRFAAALLAACWLWVAWAYHLERYAVINWAAPGFAALFALEALVLLWFGVIRGRFHSAPAETLARRTGSALFAFGLGVYPLLNPLMGHGWTRAEVFGIAPDPTAIATLGVLLMARKAPWPLWIGPVAWCLVTGLALWTLQAPHAFLPPLAALLAAAAALGSRH
jgi:hypothetical protein